MSNKNIVELKNKATEYSYYIGTLDKATEVLSNAKAKNKNINDIINGQK